MLGSRGVGVLPGRRVRLSLRWLNVLAGLVESIPITLLAVLPALFNLASERIVENEKALLLRPAALAALQR